MSHELGFQPRRWVWPTSLVSLTSRPSCLTFEKVLTVERWSDSDDSLLCNEKRHSCLVRINRHHIRSLDRLRLRQELHHHPDEESWPLWCGADAFYWHFGSGHKLWNCPRNQQQ